MADESRAGLTDSVVIKADPETIMEVLGDFESYPEWMSGVEETEVRKRDKKKRAIEVRYRIDAVLTKIEYVLSYSYKEENRIEIGYVEGELEDVNSWYLLEPLDGERTEVTYHYDVEYSIPAALRGPLARRLLKQVDKRVMNAALKDLKRRVES